MPEPQAPIAPKTARTVKTIRAVEASPRIKLVTQPLPEPIQPLRPKPSASTTVSQTTPKSKTPTLKQVKETSTPIEAVQKTPTLMTEEKSAPRRKRPKTPPPKAHGYLRLSASDKILLFKHLSVMLEAGIPLQEALEVLLDQLSNASVKTILGVAVADLSDGYQMSWSLAKYPHIFGPFLTNVMAVGEESGTLATQLKYLADQLEKKQELDGKVRSALMYPTIVFVGALGIGAYLAFFLLPKLVPMFLSLKIDLPITTRMLIWMSQNLLVYWKGLTLGFFGLIVIGILLFRLKPIKAMVHSAILSVPIFGKIVRDMQLVQVARVLGTLLASGLHIVPALEVTRVSLTNLTYQTHLREVADAVERGENLAASLKKYPRLFSKTAVSMVGVGERTGRLSSSLLSLADFAEREVDNATKNLSSLIEPIMLMAVGILVGFVALSIITPIYQLTQGMSR